MILSPLAFSVHFNALLERDFLDIDVGEKNLKNFCASQSLYFRHAQGLHHSCHGDVILLSF